MVPHSLSLPGLCGVFSSFRRSQQSINEARQPASHFPASQYHSHTCSLHLLTLHPFTTFLLHPSSLALPPPPSLYPSITTSSSSVSSNTIITTTFYTFSSLHAVSGLVLLHLQRHS
ncbi:hypothetical protein E2C01_093487 [Portunus trituberculatus]|uniref:Uncharacterized protein n=1 Tax=Portunus trituberculatus TaxID=210409 RepID=A0A5B7K0L3_PORTR|nr:hypothetical protein [Portunus trituberculatus]